MGIILIIMAAATLRSATKKTPRQKHALHRAAGRTRVSAHSRKVVVKARASVNDVQRKVARVTEAATVAAVSLQASPAFALIDKRMNGDGTGRPLGVNDPILFWVLLGVFGAMWAVYSTSVKEINPATDDDDGLSL